MFDFIDIFIIGSGFSIMTLSFAILTRDAGYSEKIIVFLFYFMWGANTVFILFEYTGYYKLHPHLLYLNQPFELFVAPLLYYFYRVKLEGRMKFNLLAAALFAPGVLAVLYFIPFFIQSPEVKLASINFNNMPHGVIRSIYITILYSAIPYLIFCLALIIIHGGRMLSDKGRRLILHKKILIAYNLLWIAIGIVVYFANLTHNNLMVRVLFLTVNIALIFFYFIERKYEGFFSLIRQDISENKYKKSGMKGIKTQAVLLRIRELMEFENIYRDEKLSLRKMSAILRIKPYQLSGILNNELNTNFNAFVNGYRIDAAKKMLLESRDERVLFIAYQCGFYSKTVFNTTFARITGMTPSEFREKYNNHKK